jgi:Protein of unknown function (DUF2891)
MDATARERLLRANADAYARVALTNVRRAYPTAVPYYLTAPGPLRAPRELHPSFYGSFDWHSSVEMHWVLVRLVRRYPDLPLGHVIRALLDDHFAENKLAAEAAYFTVHRGFERPYGWGWALRLANELRGWDDRDGEGWLRSFAPLAGVLRDGLCAWLPSATYPQRTGLHGNSAFGLSLAFDFARTESRGGRPELERAIVDAARRWYANDVDYPARFEPSGSDFLSPALAEAELMRSLLTEDEFIAWFDRFLPMLTIGEPRALLEPAIVTDTSDGQLAHLHGLNLSRAFCMRRIVEALPSGDARVGVLESSIDRLAAASLSAAVGSDYMLEHWLPAFAVLLLS